MTAAKKYLETLREREPQLWEEPLKESVLTESDLSEIEKGLGYKLPAPYREFLLSYKMPGDITVFVSWRNWTDRILFNVIQTTIAKNFLKKAK